MPRGEALVGPCSFGEWVGCGDRDFELAASIAGPSLSNWRTPEIAS